MLTLISMPRLKAHIGAVALVVITLCPPQATSALGLRLGPFHLHLPIPGYHGRRVARSEPIPPEPAEGVSPTLLYPILAWPSLYDDIFWPRTSSAWAFGYEDIFDQAFARYSYSPQRASDLCPYRMSTDEVVTRITRDTMPTAAQRPLLQKLATALGQANGYLIKSCPSEIPKEPVARLQLMEHQIDATIMALQIVRPPLQEFARSLDDKQRARFDGAPPSSEIPGASCKLSALSVNGPLIQVEQAVRPTDEQRREATIVADAFNRAAIEFETGCRSAVPPTALARLDATVSRLDATWRAVQAIEVALANFQKDLSDEQSARFNALEIAVTR
jgi:LTXXQ motif family protein